MFPRPIGRGPIEAVLGRGPCAAPPRFPRPIGRGPIEATIFNAASADMVMVSTSDWTWPH